MIFLDWQLTIKIFRHCSVVLLHFTLEEREHWKPIKVTANRAMEGVKKFVTATISIAPSGWCSILVGWWTVVFLLFIPTAEHSSSRRCSNLKNPCKANESGFIQNQTLPIVMSIRGHLSNGDPNIPEKQERKNLKNENDL